MAPPTKADRPTVHTIGAACGVSGTTVSLALRNDPRLPEHTRQRIQAYAEKVGYRPNQTARNLKRSATGSLAIILPSPTWWVDTLLLDVFYREALARGYDIQLQITHDDLHQEARAVSRCLDGRVDGMFLLASFDTLTELPCEYPIDELGRGHIPCVVCGHEPMNLPRVRRDRPRAIELAARHLVEQGYDCVCLLLAGRTREVRGAAHRIAAFEAACHALGRPDDADRVYFRNAAFQRLAGPAGSEPRLFFDYQAHGRYGYEMMADVLQEMPRGQRLGVICASDGLAGGALRYCREQGFEVPGQIGLIGADDTLAQDLGLSSFRWDHEAMARFVLDALQQPARTRGAVSEELLVPPTLIARQSTRLNADADRAAIQ